MANKGLKRARTVDLLWDSEEQFAATVVAWLRDQKWEVYQEVQPERDGSRADIVAVQNRILWVVETKLNYSLELLWQAKQWLGFAHYVSIAVPYGSARSRGRDMTLTVCKALGVGLLTGRVYGYGIDGGDVAIEERMAPHLERKISAHYLRDFLSDRHKDYAPAGNARSLYYTPFKRTCESVLAAVKKTPGITMKELIASIQTHYASEASARSCLAYWIEAGKVEGVRGEKDKGKWRLYPAEGETLRLLKD